MFLSILDRRGEHCDWRALVRNTQGPRRHPGRFGGPAECVAGGCPQLGTRKKLTKPRDAGEHLPIIFSSDYLLGLTRIERPEEFTREELAQIREFEEFLMWKKRSRYG